MIEQPMMVKICDIQEESPGVKTFFFKLNLNFEPGQFVMVWIPLLDENPLPYHIFKRAMWVSLF